MLQQVQLETNRTITENGAEAHVSTLDSVLDFFASIGATRHLLSTEIKDKFMKAFAADKLLAMKALFYSRDIRNGLGERRSFRIILQWLSIKSPESLAKNLNLIAEFGRWDDLTYLLDTSLAPQIAAIIKNQLRADMRALKANRIQDISLCAKWLPSENTSSEDTKARARILIKLLNISPREYRKKLSKLRASLRILENNLRTKDYTFDYSKQPSQAMLKYQKAFWRNDAERFADYQQAVKQNKANINTATLAPYQIVGKLLNGQTVRKLSAEENVALDNLWNNLPDYAGASNSLVILDGSASMYWGSQRPLPAAVAQALAIYFAERNQGAFYNHFITFSRRPQLVEVKGETISEKLEYTISYNDCSNTNIEAVFKLILDTAVATNLPKNQMPEKLYIISDMQFDRQCGNADLPIFIAMKKLYQEAGYQLPQIVFWNVNAAYSSYPVTKNDQGAILVSGFNANLFKMIEANNFDFNPLDFMLSVLNNEIYSKISV